MVRSAFLWASLFRRVLKLSNSTASTPLSAPSPTAEEMGGTSPQGLFSVLLSWPLRASSQFTALSSPSTGNGLVRGRKPPDVLKLLPCGDVSYYRLACEPPKHSHLLRHSEVFKLVPLRRSRCITVVSPRTFQRQPCLIYLCTCWSSSTPSHHS